MMKMIPATIQPHMEGRGVCEDAFAEQIRATNLANAQTGRKGDGIVTVSDIESLHRNRDAHTLVPPNKDAKQ